MTTDNLPENFGQDEDLENEIGNFIVLTDEDDNDTTFELLAIMEYEEKNYVVLYPVDDEEEDSALVILEAVAGHKCHIVTVAEGAENHIYLRNDGDCRNGIAV